jgi:hypothetical protein
MIHPEEAPMILLFAKVNLMEIHIDFSYKLGKQRKAIGQLPGSIPA